MPGPCGLVVKKALKIRSAFSAGNTVKTQLGEDGQVLISVSDIGVGSLLPQKETVCDRIAGIDGLNQGVFAPNPAVGRTALFQNCHGDLGRNPCAEPVLRSYRSLTRSVMLVLTPVGASQAAE